ncbi:MAG TPA: nucleotide pyrophosphohydrolase [Patescibacteria group bacterium]|nr:nucleotide pyrophosphohydrolase [Patescibacteria group bacterium]
MQKLTQQIIQFRDKRNWRQFYTPKDMALALVAEVGELIEHFKWHKEKETVRYIAKHKKEIGEEIADVFYWILLISLELDIDIEKAFDEKMKKNNKKYPAKEYKNKHTNPA